MYRLLLGDCLVSMGLLEDSSVDSVVCDPPYGLSFMGKKWDYDVPSVDIWRECYRVLKPGGYLLAFAGTRTQHRMAVNIEDAGFEIRDMIAWVYGSGFPKSHNVSVSIDKLHGHGNRGKAIPTASSYQASDVEQENKLTSNPVPPYEAKSDDAKKWEGWGTALKPSLEPITVARKPLVGTVANNVLEYGTGGMNIDACRVPMDAADYEQLSKGVDQIRQRGGVMDNSWKNSSDLSGANPANPLGRWPANFIHDGSQAVLDLFPDTQPSRSGGMSYNKDTQHLNGKQPHARTGHDDLGGSAARYFYCAKANKADRNEGLDDFEEDYNRGTGTHNNGKSNTRVGNAAERAAGITHVELQKVKNIHPTVKPTDLMRYLCRLVTQPGGTVLDPFMGSGTTGKAAMLDGLQFIGCEMDEQYYKIAEARIKHALESNHFRDAT
jgi:site-specific DNA-methyltransferase (adenine-specific)